MGNYETIATQFRYYCYLFNYLFYKILNLWSVLSPCREEILTVATDAEAAEISGTELLSKEEEAAIGESL